MPDIKLRLNKDMLVLSTPVLSALARLGIDVEHDVEFTLLLEPDTLEDAYKLEFIAGAQCLVAATASVTPARLARAGMEDRAAEVVSAALGAVRAQVPQHVLAEIGPCGLPLDASSKASLRENLDQYARAGRLFAQEEFDAFFLNGFSTCADLKCALMGLRKVSDAPVFASVDVAADGTLRSGRGTLEEAMGIMEDLGADVAGFSTCAPQEAAVDLARRAANATALPLLAQLEVRERNARQQGPTPENPYYVPDAMVAAVDALRAAGVQFLRAVGDATPAYSGALVATTMGLDAVVRESAAGEGEGGAGAGAAGAASGAGSGGDGSAPHESTAPDAAPAASSSAVSPAASDPAASAGAIEDELADFIARARERVAAALGDNLAIVEADGPRIEGR
ncbi:MULTISPECIES: homocysteine S-methyltransferase family protein [unclassified Adlercreutzia]|uniref:homocysteine S-methyltransferase family protein n=1 Tax=unclassified Adlercreutzia TaxID=2636013 RepID=UPI0013EA169C|nr:MULTISPECIES: homocysteine S-methyltransferase family protein [unclassified Adlercreutzia]